MAHPTIPFQGENLARFRYHTGATLRPVAEDEPCRVLFRDIGPWAMARFLRGQLQRLSGPLAPILYMRTADYEEPYVDYEAIGRLVFLQPKQLHPWHSGVPTIFVASLRQIVNPRSIGFVSGHLGPHDAERRLQGAVDIDCWREALAGRGFDEIVQEMLASLDRLNSELAQTERWAEPLRKRLQSRRRR